MLVPIEPAQQRREEIAEVREHAAEHRPITRVGDEAVGLDTALRPIETRIAIDQMPTVGGRALPKAMPADRHASLAVDQQRQPVVRLRRHPPQQGLQAQ